jgi:hypothetical protein
MRYESMTTYEKVCKDQGKDPKKLPDYPESSPAEVKYHLSGFRLARVLVSINKDEKGKEWKPKPTDLKRILVFYIVKDDSKPSGFGLSLVGVAGDYSNTGVAARLTFRDVPRAEFAFKHYQEDFENLILYKP